MSDAYTDTRDACRILNHMAESRKEECEKLRAENAELRGQKTTTYEPLISDSRGYANQFKCDYCGCTVDTPYYMRPEQFDYIYCPYCGRYITGNEE